jgi:hypothetical protein
VEKMAVLWFAREGPDATRGFPAFDFPIETIASKLGGKRNFEFLSSLDAPPITVLGRSSDAVDYRLSLLELDDIEAEAVKWRAGFYRIAFSPAQVVGKLGKPNPRT